MDMKLLIPLSELNSFTSREKSIPVECETCHNPFYTTKHEVQNALASKKRNLLRFCSRACFGKTLDTRITIKCEWCGIPVTKKKYDVNRSTHSFCSQKCAAIHGNTNKNFGLSKRSKLEFWLETQLLNQFPTVEFLFGDRKTLNGLELDIYIPKLSLAFELSGIFHFDPVLGKKQLAITQKRDKKKEMLCNTKGILLFQVDTRKMKNFNESDAAVFKQFVESKITLKLAERARFELAGQLSLPATFPM